MTQEEWERFQTKLSGVFYAWCFVGLVAAVVTMIARWCLQ